MAGLIVIGHVDGVQHVAGNLMNFLNWVGFHMPQNMIASWVGPNDKDTTKDWDEIQKNKYTREDRENLVHSVLRLAYDIKNSQGVAI
ncbi:MAG: hypothetical protein SCH39_12315 [Methanosarcinales archaeon]|nr:hypothetical protein [Methanosarcinales archaeon]